MSRAKLLSHAKTINILKLDWSLIIKFWDKMEN